eukprot:403351065
MQQQYYENDQHMNNINDNDYEDGQSQQNSNNNYEQDEDTLSQYQDQEQQPIADSRVVKTVRNLKRISSATPKKHISGNNLPQNTQQQQQFFNNNQQYQINHQNSLGQQSNKSFQMQNQQQNDRGVSGGSLKQSNQNIGDSSFTGAGEMNQRMIRITNQNSSIMQNNIRNSNNASNTMNLLTNAQIQQAQQQAPKKEETVEERIRRIRGKNNPNALQPSQEEIMREKLQVIQQSMAQQKNSTAIPYTAINGGAGNLMGLQLQKINSSLGMSSNKNIPLYSANGAVNITRTHTNSIAPANNGLPMQQQISLKMNNQNQQDQSFISDQSMIMGGIQNQSFGGAAVVVMRNGQQQQQSTGSVTNKHNINGKLPSSKSTTADTNNQDINNIYSQQQLNQQDDAYFQNQYQEREEIQMGAIRGVNPDSNIILQNDQVLLDSKKDKCIELMRNSTTVHDTLQKFKQDSQMTRNFNLDLNFLIQIMFTDKHFLNLLTAKLAKNQAANKLEKFLADKIQEKLKEMQNELQIKSKLEAVSQRIQDRLNRLKECIQ